MNRPGVPPAAASRPGAPPGSGGRGGGPEAVDVVRLAQRVRGLQFRSRRLLDAGLAGAYRSVFRGPGIEAEGLREYTLDDDAARIDWQVSARVQRPHLRVFREERELTCLLLVDISASMHCAATGPAPRSVAAELAALLAMAAARNRDRVGLLLFSTAVDLWLAPAHSRGQVLRLIRELVAREPAARGTRLAAGLGAALRLLPGRALVFLISDMLTPVPEAELARLARRHEVIVLRLVSGVPPWAALSAALWLEDAETGECTVVTPARALAADVRQQAAQRDRARRQAALAAGADWVDLPCGPEALTALAAYLARRQGRRAPAAIPGEAIP